MAKEEKEKEYLIVPDLPQVPTRTVTGNDGNEYDLITLTEAVKECLDILRELKKAI